VPRAKRAAAVANARERCGLGAVGGRLLGNLSRGYQQRAGIAQAIVHSPEVVILDEPTVGLDPQQIVEIRELISELGDRHSVILSTHILPEVQTVCGRVLIIHEGRLVLDSAVETARGAGGRPGFTVGLRNPPTPEEIEALDFAIDVQVLDRLRFRITCRADTDGAEIAAAAAKGGWELFELIPESGTLEEIFLKATRGELAAPAGQT
jgi:ABC-2 type transport system ATP-binding protein